MESERLEPKAALPYALSQCAPTLALACAAAPLVPAAHCKFPRLPFSLPSPARRPLIACTARLFPSHLTDVAVRTTSARCVKLTPRTSAPSLPANQSQGGGAGEEVFCGFLSRSWDNWNLEAVREGEAGSPILRLTGPALVVTSYLTALNCKNRHKPRSITLRPNKAREGEREREVAVPPPLMGQLELGSGTWGRSRVTNAPPHGSRVIRYLLRHTARIAASHFFHALPRIQCRALCMVPAQLRLPATAFPVAAQL